MSERDKYAEHFAESAEAVWGKERANPLRVDLLKTGAAAWDIDNFKLEPWDEPEPKPHPSKENPK